MTTVLRDYQLEARNAVWMAFRAGTRSGLLILPTGAGKTVTCASIIEPLHNHGKRVLFVVHRKELLEQAKETFERFGLTCGLEKASQRVDVANLPDVTLTTPQSLKGERLERFSPSAFHIVVVDEGHRGSAASYRAICEHFTSAKILALTATPDRADGVPLANVYESVLYEMTLPDAVARGILAPIELLDVEVESLNLDDIKTHAGDFAQGELEAEILRDSVLHGMAKPLSEHAADRKIAAFLPGVKSAHRFVEVCAGYGITAVAVDGGMKDDARAEAFAKYARNEVQLIACADLLSEGWDSPRTDCVALCSPTKSRGRLVQRIGRGTRKAEGKANCLVINFCPGSVKHSTLVSPRDALAGCPAMIREAVGRPYTKREDERIAGILADEQAAFAERRQIVKTVGVEYGVMRMTLAQFLSASDIDAIGYPPATDRQMSMLDRMGCTPDELSHVHTYKEAQAVIDALDKRRESGLCTRKQYKLLSRYGYPDTLTFAQAGEVISQLKARGWKQRSMKRAS